MSALVIPLPTVGAATALPTELPKRFQPGPKIITVQGDKFNRDRNIADVAKLVRADIKAAIASNLLPKGIKCSVRIERYSMGRTLHVTVTACPVMVVNPAFVRWSRNNPHASMLDAPAEASDRYSPEGRHILNTLTSIVEAFNRRVTSNQPDDYSNVAFHTDIQFDIDLRNGQSAAILALQPKVSLRNAWKPATLDIPIAQK